MLEDAKLNSGADGGCPNNQSDQPLTTRCGGNGPIDAQKELGAAPAPDRERRFIERDYAALTGCRVSVKS